METSNWKINELFFKMCLLWIISSREDLRLLSCSYIWGPDPEQHPSDEAKHWCVEFVPLTWLMLFPFEAVAVIIRTKSWKWIDFLQKKLNTGQFTHSNWVTENDSVIPLIWINRVRSFSNPFWQYTFTNSTKTTCCKYVFIRNLLAATCCKQVRTGHGKQLKGIY